MRGLQAARGTAIAAVPRPDAVIPAARARWLIGAIAILGYALDQGSKAAVLAWLDPQDPVRLLGGLLTFRLVFNPGAAFSLGENLTVGLTCLAIGALAFVLLWMSPRVRNRLWAVATGLLACGIAGNLTDRLFRPPGPFRGEVVDFISLPYFAIFNVADMCLVAAVVVIIANSFFSPVTMAGARVAPEGERPDSRSGVKEVDAEGTKDVGSERS